MVKKSYLVLICLLLCSNIAVGQSECEGVERWSVKTLSDVDTQLVRFDSVATTTVAELARLPKLKTGHNTPRLPEEREVYMVTGRLLHYKREPDRDLHLVLKDLSSDSTIVLEVPDPACPEAASTSRASAYAAIIQWIKDSVGNPTTKFKDTDKLVRVTGVRFGDFWHGQRGMAHNCLELHPILTIESGEIKSGVAEPFFQPKLRISPNPASRTLHVEAQLEEVKGIVSILDAAGVTVLSAPIKFHGGKGEVILDISALPSSFYLVQVASGDGYIGQKVLISR